MKNKLKVGILGATGMVGQRFITLLENHPWFEVVTLAASASSAGKPYEEAVFNRWKLTSIIPERIKKLQILAVENDAKKITSQVDLVFCALDMEKEKIKKIESAYAGLGVPVISNNSANRWTEDIPMVIPEVNPEHLELINVQRKNRGWKKGFIVVKPNCSIQSYVLILTALKEFKPQKVEVVSMQAISGAGKTFEVWPEMIDNVIPFIENEEEKSEKEPLKIWGEIKNHGIESAIKPDISANCIRVPVSNGHLSCVSVSFKKKPDLTEIMEAIKHFRPLESLNLPSAPTRPIVYFEDENRPQTKIDRDRENGMGISMGRLRPGKFFDWEFIGLSHNTIRGAAGGAILTAELLIKKAYL